MVAVLEKFIRRLKMVLAKTEIELCWKALLRQVKTHLIIISYALVANWKRDYPAAKTLLVL